MSPEERDELMNFILQTQSDTAENLRDLNESLRLLRESHAETMKEQKEHTVRIQELAAASQALLEVARIHSRRLDRLEGL